MSQPTSRWDGEGKMDKPKRLSAREKMHGVATNVYSRKPVVKNIPDSGVVFTFEEGISTSHICPKGQQP